jgi:hypothetical protein
VNLTYNLAEYFVRIRDLVCAHVPASARAVCPAANCSIMLKMFPVYVDGDTVIDHTPSPGHASCQAAQNIKAMKAWKDALHSFELDPKVATLNFERKEVDRQFSNFHRFTSIGTEFDCSYPRPTPTFAVEAVKHTQLQLQAESCWVHPQVHLPAISPLSSGHLPNISRSSPEYLPSSRRRPDGVWWLSECVGLPPSSGALPKLSISSASTRGRCLIRVRA